MNGHVGGGRGCLGGVSLLQQSRLGIRAARARLKARVGRPGGRGRGRFIMFVRCRWLCAGVTSRRNN